MSLLLTFVTASFLLETLILCYLSRVLSGNYSSIYVHWDGFVLLAIRGFVCLELLSQSVPPGLFGACIVIPSISQRFFDDTKASDFMPGMFFPIIYGFQPCVSFEYCRKDTLSESIFELFDGSYFGSRNLGPFEKVLKLGNVFINKVLFHFKFTLGKLKFS